MKFLILLLSVFFTSQAMAVNLDDITCNIHLGEAFYKLENPSKSYAKVVFETGKYQVMNLSSDLINPDVISLGIFGPNGFQLNVELPVSSPTHFARTTLSGAAGTPDMGIINIICSLKKTK